jgi:hypothetical protein
MKAFVLGLVTTTLASGLLYGADVNGSFDRSLTVSEPVELDVTTDSGGISVTPGPSGKLHVHAILKSHHGLFNSDDLEARIRELESHPPVEQTGNRVRIGYVHDRHLLRGISMRFEIETPADTALHARADSGGIEVRELRDRLDCKTDSGGIEIRDAGSDVHAEADSGGIRIHSVKGAVFAHVDSGGIDAIDVAGALDAQADSGHIRLVQTSPAPIRARADSGGISVKLAPGAGYDVTAEADSGSISVPEMTVRSSFSRHHIEGKVHGGGPLVSVQVDSGGITID